MNELAFELSAEWAGSEQQSGLSMTHLLTTLQKKGSYQNNNANDNKSIAVATIKLQQTLLFPEILPLP